MVEPQIVLESDVEPEHWSDPVRGTLSFRTLANGSTPAPGLTAGVAVMQAGGWLGRHRHDPAETYYVLEGEGVLTLDGEDHHLTPGAVVFIPGDSEHGVRHVGEGPLRVFYVLAAGSFEDVEYRFSEQD
jgi:quercetin dioxygenase-like cupin family protein